MPKTSRPGRGTMAGMIYDANGMLNWILGDPNMKEAFRNSSVIGNSIISSSDFRTSSRERPSKAIVEEKKKVPEEESSSHSLSKLFSDDDERDLLGIGFFTIWEAGLMVSGYAGTGIVLSRNIMTGKWSSPVAVMVSGIGAGILLGASVKTVVYLIYDYFTLKSISGTDGGIIFGAGTGATVGTWTIETGKQASYITSPKMLRTAGIGTNVALCRGVVGVYGAVSVEAGICRCRDKINARFYGRENVSGSDVLLSGESMEIPNNTKGMSNYQAKQLLEKIHSKLERLCDRDGSDHGIKKYDNSTKNLEHSNDGNSINNNSSDTNNKPEKVQATLEELFADDSYDNNGWEEQEGKDKSSKETNPAEDSLVVVEQEAPARESISAQ